jgi:hypothetical protein
VRVKGSTRDVPELGAKPCAKCGDFILRIKRHWMRRDYWRAKRQNSIYRRPDTILSPREARSKRRIEPDPRPPDLVAERPATRGDCAGGERPCPWVSCKHHLYLEVSTDGAIKLNFPDLEPWQLTKSCALDIADERPITLDQVGEVMNLTRERIRQVERRALSVVRGPMRTVL